MNAEENVKKSFKPKKRQPRFEGEPACEYRRGGGSARGRPRVAWVVPLMALLSTFTLVSFLSGAGVTGVTGGWRVVQDRYEYEYNIEDAPSFEFEEEPDGALFRLDLEAFQVVGTPHEPEPGYIEVVFITRDGFDYFSRRDIFFTVGYSKVSPDGDVSSRGISLKSGGRGMWSEYAVKFRLPRYTSYPVTVDVNVRLDYFSRMRPLKASFRVARRRI